MQPDPNDPDVIALSKAIIQHESGGDFNAVGDAGTSHGAAQWQPATWKAQAKDVLGDENAQMTPENQKAVLAGSIAKDKASGLNPAQIAAKWNSGQPNGWENKIGTTEINGQQIKYNVPAYVKSVTDIYHQNKGSGAQPVTQTQGFNPTPFSGNNPGQFDFSGLQPEPTPAPQPQKGGILGSLAQGAGNLLTEAEKPFLGVAAIPTQLLAKAMGRPDPFAQGIPAGIPGMPNQAEVTPLNLEKKAGDIAQVASYAIPGGKGLGAVAGGIGTGVLQGAGSAMSRGENLGQVASQGAIGGALGGALTGVTKLAGAGIRGIGDTLSGAGAERALKDIKDAYASALNLNAAERGFEHRSGKDLAQVLLDNGIALGRHANGTLDASQAIPKLQQVLEQLNQAADALVGNPEINTKVSSFIPLAKVEDELISRIRSSSMDSLEKERSIATAKKLIAATRREYGDVISPQIGEKIKQGLQGSAFKKALTTADSLQKNTTYLASKIMRSNVEKSIGGELGKQYSLINKQRGDLVDAITRLSKLDEQRLLKGGRLGNMAGGIVGAISGAASGLGPLGALAGDYFGTKAAEFMNNPVTKIGAAKLKAKGAGILPGLVGSAGRTAGKGISALGQGVGNGARAVGLLGNLMSSK